MIGATFDGTPFAPTQGKQWEGGVKYDARGLGDDIKLFATAAVFRIDQTNVLTTDTRAGAPLFAQIQEGKVKSEGAELEVVGRFHEKLSVNASYSFTNARVALGDNAGARLAAQPRHKASLLVDYTHDVGALAGFGGGAGIRYLSNSPGIVGAPYYYSPSVTVFDGTLHYDIPGWRLAVNGSNLFDKRYAGRCSGQYSCFFGEGRQVVGTVTKKF